MLSPFSYWFKLNISFSGAWKGSKANLDLLNRMLGAQYMLFIITSALLILCTLVWLLYLLERSLTEVMVAIISTSEWSHVWRAGVTAFFFYFVVCRISLLPYCLGPLPYYLVKHTSINFRMLNFLVDWFSPLCSTMWGERGQACVHRGCFVHSMLILGTENIAGHAVVIGIYIESTKSL